MTKDAAKNADTPDRVVELGGRKITLRFSVRAVMALKERWGLKTEDDVQKKIADAKGLGVEDFVTMIWAATRSHHPELTEPEVLEMLDKSGLQGIGEVAEKVLAAAMPRAKPSPRAPAGGKRNR